MYFCVVTKPVPLLGCLEVVALESRSNVRKFAGSWPLLRSSNNKKPDAILAWLWCFCSFFASNDPSPKCSTQESVAAPYKKYRKILNHLHFSQIAVRLQHYLFFALSQFIFCITSLYFELCCITLSMWNSCSVTLTFLFFTFRSRHFLIFCVHLLTFQQKCCATSWNDRYLRIIASSIFYIWLISQYFHFPSTPFASYLYNRHTLCPISYFPLLQFLYTNTVRSLHFLKSF